MKKRFFTLLTLFLCIGCIESPLISLKDIRLEGIVQGNIQLKILVDIYNPNNFDVTIKSVEYKVYYEELQVGNGFWEGEEVLKGKTTMSLPFLVSVDKDFVFKIISSFFKGKNVELQSKLRVDIKAILKKYGKEFSYSYSWSYKDQKEKKSHKRGSENESSVVKPIEEQY